MGLGDKIGNKAEEAKGKMKESVADVKGDGNLKAEGKADQASANAKRASEDIKDAWKNATD